MKSKETAKSAALFDLLRHFSGTQSHEKGDKILMSEEVKEDPLPNGSGFRYGWGVRINMLSPVKRMKRERVAAMNEQRGRGQTGLSKES